MAKSVKQLMLGDRDFVCASSYIDNRFAAIRRRIISRIDLLEAELVSLRAKLEKLS